MINLDRFKRVFFFFLTLIFAKGQIYAEGMFYPSEILIAQSAYSQGVKQDDHEIVKRLIEAYRRSAKATENRGNSMWQLFFDQKHQQIHKIFLEGSLEEVAYTLRNPRASDLFFGFDSLSHSYLSLYSTRETQHHYALVCLDGLLRFAEACGALSLQSGAWPSRLDAEVITTRIEDKLRIKLSFPNPFPLELGVATPRGIVAYRVPQSLYQAWRIKQLLKDIPHPRVLEIGGGLGRTAYYARQLGIKNYTIVDLPFTAMSSGYFLGRTVGSKNILLSGEEAADFEQRIKFLTPEEFMSTASSYDLIINADGLTEMDSKIAGLYFKKIGESTPLFLSINHEMNPFTVSQLIKASEQVDQSERITYWMRQGYVEELVRFKSMKE